MIIVDNNREVIWKVYKDFRLSLGVLLMYKIK